MTCALNGRRRALSAEGRARARRDGDHRECSDVSADVGPGGGILLTWPLPKEPVPLWRWAMWWTILGAAMIVFYVLPTPIWLGLRGLARLADLQSARHRSS